MSKVLQALSVASEEVDESPALRKLLQEKPPSVAGLIDEVLERRIEMVKFFRPSMLMGCKRANVFHYMNAPWHPQRQDPRMQRILDNGTAIHEVIQAYLRDHPDYWFAPESKVMTQIRGATVRGSCDGVLIRRDDGYRFGIEIKTRAHAAFMKLSKPEPGHVDQATIYMRLQGLYWMVIVYWDKDKQHLKDYAVSFDRKRWNTLKDRVEYLKSFVDKKTLPKYSPRECDVSFCKHVDYCRKRGAPV